MKDKEKVFRAQIIIPTLNAGEEVRKLFESIQMQKEVDLKVLIIDSESTDKTTEIAKLYGYDIRKIKAEEYGHGTTRQLGIDLCPEADFIIFLTQDVILTNEYSVQTLLKCFKEEKVGCAYGRQLPHKNANVLAAHARLFNYPEKSKKKSIKDIEDMGLKTVFISNSFAAYRKKALRDIGGFPKHVNFSEDTYVAAKMLLKKWEVYYCAEAKVYHSHNYTIIEEYRRYFEIGMFHGREKWIREVFGKTEKEGRKFIFSEIKYLLKENKIHIIINATLRNICKYIGYRIGIKQ